MRIWNQPFRVIGVVASTNWATTGAVGDDQFDAVYVPLTAVHRLLNLTKLNSITITSRSAGETTDVSRRVTALLRQRHGIGDADPDDFVVRTQASVALGKGVSRDVARAITGNAPGLEQLTLEQLSKTLERSSRTMTLLLASVAGVSLLVGGIGIMNIMLLSVTERTREIGLRMAIGARSRDVLMQFLAEAVTLSLIGGVIGVVLALVAASGVERVLRWSADVSIRRRHAGGRRRRRRRRVLRTLSGPSGRAARSDRRAEIRVDAVPYRPVSASPCAPSIATGCARP